MKINKIVADKIKYSPSSNKDKEDWEKLLNQFITYFPLIGVFFYGTGFLYLKFYYENFGIEIENYLTLNDLIYIGLTKLIDILVYGVIIVAIFVIGYKILDYIFTNYFKNIAIRISPMKIIIFLWFTLLVVIYIAMPKYRFLPMFGVCVALPFLKYIRPQKKVIEFDFELSIVAAFYALYHIITGLGTYESDNLKYFYQEIDPQTIISDNYKYYVDGNDYRLVGETSSNIFLYKNSKNITIVLKREDIRQIIVGERQ